MLGRRARRRVAMRHERSPATAACGAASVPVMWSLELLLELVLAGQFPTDQALAIAEELHRLSPRHFTTDIVADFSRGIDERSAR